MAGAQMTGLLRASAALRGIGRAAQGQRATCALPLPGVLGYECTVEDELGVIVRGQNGVGHT